MSGLEEGLGPPLLVIALGIFIIPVIARRVGIPTAAAEVLFGVLLGMVGRYLLEDQLGLEFSLGAGLEFMALMGLLILLFLAGLIIYAVMTNLKLVEGLKEEDDGDLEARERRLAEREREFQRKVDRTQDSEPEEETRDSGSEETAEETGPQEDKAPEPEPPAEDPSPFNEEAATQALGGIAPPHPINGADEPGAPDEPDPEPQE